MSHTPQSSPSKARGPVNASVRRTAREHKITCAMHFAARSLVGESMLKPDLYYENNVGGSIALLQAMAAKGVKQIVFSSSATVYGEPETVPITEDALPAWC